MNAGPALRVGQEDAPGFGRFAVMGDAQPQARPLEGHPSHEKPAPRLAGPAGIPSVGVLVPRVRVQTNLRRRTNGPHGPRPLTARERRRVQLRGLDTDGLDVAAGEIHDERMERAREAARFRDLIIREGLAALLAFDQVTEQDAPPSRRWIASIILEVAS